MAVKQIFWHEQSIDYNIALELGVQGVYGFLDQFDKKTLEIAKHYMYELVRNGVKGQYYGVDTDDKDYRIVYMNQIHAEVWRNLDTETLFDDKTIGGIILADPEEGFVTWQERKMWISTFLTQLRKKLLESGKKSDRIKVFVRIYDAGAIPEIFQMVDGIIIYPLNGVIFNKKFILPLGGFLDLSSDAVDNVRGVIFDVSKLLGIQQGVDESYPMFIRRLQCRVFDFEVKRAQHMASGGILSEFTYNDTPVDIDKIYELAVIRGLRGNDELQNMVELTEIEIQNAISGNKVDPILNTMGRILAISVGRVQFGNKLDNANKWLSKGLAEEIKTALQFTDKFATLVMERRKRLFEEKVALKKIEIEEKKLELEKKKLDPKAPPEQVPVIEGLGDEEAEQLTNSTEETKELSQGT